jgi:hypothetical protein
MALRLSSGKTPWRPRLSGDWQPAGPTGVFAWVPIEPRAPGRQSTGGRAAQINTRSGANTPVDLLLPLGSFRIPWWRRSVWQGRTVTEWICWCLTLQIKKTWIRIGSRNRFEGPWQKNLVCRRKSSRSGIFLSIRIKFNGSASMSSLPQYKKKNLCMRNKLSRKTN